MSKEFKQKDQAVLEVAAKVDGKWTEHAVPKAADLPVPGWKMLLPAGDRYVEVRDGKEKMFEIKAVVPMLDAAGEAHGAIVVSQEVSA